MTAVTSPVASLDRLGPEPGARVAVVGARGGIGRALVDALLDGGARVAALDTADALARHPGRDGAEDVAVDVTEDASVAAAFARCEALFGGLDGLVYLSGFADPPKPAADTALARFDATLDVNLRGAFATFQAALPLMGGGGSVVAISSGLAANVEKGFSAYSASKAGLVALLKVLAKERAPVLRVNAVAPGPVSTPFLAGGLGRGGDEAGGPAWFGAFAAGAKIAESTPMGRIAEPADVVGPVLFLLGPASRFMTGQVLYVNGGRFMP